MGGLIFMSMEYGFYNSINGDRAYNAEQMSRIFDGLIGDGIYATVGDHMIVSPNPDDTDSVIVGTGRAWFNHTWSHILSAEIMKGPEPDITKPRMDAIVLDIDSDERENRLLWITGTPDDISMDGGFPAVPLINTETHHQYPLAWIYRPAGDSHYILQTNITNAVGTSRCPFVTGIIDTIDTDDLVQKWESEWETFVSDSSMTFNDWFEGVRDILDEDAAGNLANRILILEERVDSMPKELTCDGVNLYEGSTISASIQHAITYLYMYNLWLDNTESTKISDPLLLTGVILDTRSFGQGVVSSYSNYAIQIPYFALFTPGQLTTNSKDPTDVIRCNIKTLFIPLPYENIINPSRKKVYIMEMPHYGKAVGTLTRLSFRFVNLRTREIILKSIDIAEYRKIYNGDYSSPVQRPFVTEYYEYRKTLSGDNVVEGIEPVPGNAVRSIGLVSYGL